MIDLYGADYSVYVRAVRLALAQKGVPCRLHPIDVFAPQGPPDDYLDLHPFGRIPALRHGDFALHETTAILRYVDEAFDGPSLQPDTPRDRARMTQIQSILDSYAYRTLVWDIYVERVVKPRDGGVSDEVGISCALGPARKVVAALETLAGPGPFLSGAQPTLADCHAAPMLALFHKAEEGALLLRAAPRLTAWLDVVKSWAAFQATEPATRT
ncbi:glutathione S-transferase family protein [Labrenzia sp. 011]|uniref:glutathione S-transferase family protein n=1 Tax=Labrenzia sp. 011 TaxID=2171494 RepID=UPI000D51FC3F|nr:glutathione S-transferase family protein [Labrenzia sp. 011]PVB59928.1 glutathione S-transferase family protein [Labrenzia sp. 011]